MEAIESEKTTGLRCASCNGEILPLEKFCGYCGKEILSDASEIQEDTFAKLSPTLWYYFITLILLSAYKLTEVFPEGIEGTVIISVIDVAIVLAFWGYHHKSLAPLFSFRRFYLLPFFLTITGAIAAAFFINFIGTLINVSLYDEVYYAPYLFEDTARPFLWATIFTCLQPAIFEEVAFRGFLYTNVQSLSSPSGAVFVSAFLFGVIHLSFISLIWLVPIGLVFAWMRMRFRTLWYGIVGHFVYNFTITVIDFMNI